MVASWPVFSQPEAQIQHNDTDVVKALEASHTSYQSAVTLLTSQQAPEHEYEWASSMLGFWMDGSMQPKTPSLQGNRESPFYQHLRTHIDCDGASSFASLSKQSRTSKQFLLMDYLGVHLDCSFMFRRRGGTPPTLTIEGVLGGEYSVEYLAEKWCPLALAMRMSALGLTLDEGNRNPRMRNIHRWSFANYLQRHGHKEHDMFYCEQSTCSAAPSFQHFCLVEEMDSHWLREADRGLAACDFQQHVAPEAASMMPDAVMLPSSTSGNFGVPSSSAVAAAAASGNAQSASLSATSPLSSLPSLPLLPFHLSSVEAAAAAAVATPSIQPQILLQPLFPTEDDPLGTALASAILNRPALLWEALQLRQLLARWCLNTNDMDQWAERILDLSFQTRLPAEPDPLLRLLTDRFNVDIYVWGPEPAAGPLQFQRSRSQHGAGSMIHFWCPNNHELIPLFHSSRSESGRVTAMYRLSPELRQQQIKFSTCLDEAHISNLTRRWDSAFEAARLDRVASAPMDVGHAGPAVGPSLYAVLLKFIGIHTYDDDAPAVEMELRQVLAHKVRQLRNAELDAEHLAFHILHPGVNTTTLHPGEVQAVANLFLITIRLYQNFRSSEGSSTGETFDTFPATPLDYSLLNVDIMHRRNAFGSFSFTVGKPRTA